MTMKIAPDISSELPLIDMEITPAKVADIASSKLYWNTMSRLLSSRCQWLLKWRSHSESAHSNGLSFLHILNLHSPLEHMSEMARRQISIHPVFESSKIHFSGGFGETSKRAWYESFVGSDGTIGSAGWPASRDAVIQCP
jgi:hypothetical protein